MLADYCPYNQELSYKNSNRDSRCYRTENQPPSIDKNLSIFLLTFVFLYFKIQKTML